MNTGIIQMSRHMKKRDLMVYPFVVLQMPMHSPYLGYRHAFFAWSFLKVSTMYANSKGSGETALMRSLVWAFAGRLCDKYPF